MCGISSWFSEPCSKARRRTWNCETFREFISARNRPKRSWRSCSRTWPTTSPRSARSSLIRAPPADPSTDGGAANGALPAENKISTGSPRMGAAVSSVRAVLRRTDASPCATSAPSLFLGRGRLLHSGRARLISDRHAHSAVHAIQCASSVGHGVVGAGVARRRILHASHAHSHARALCLLASGTVSTLAKRRQAAGGVGNNRVSGALSRVLHAEFHGSG